MPTVADSLKDAAQRLRGLSDSPRLDAELLLALVLGRPRTALVAHGDLLLEEAKRGEFERLLEKRRGGAPIAYLTGTREFWSLPIAVSPAVLVPRPETELLVEQALQRIPVDLDFKVLDLGTGSGAIALAIARERPMARVTATDLSAAALEVATGNARALGLPQIRWLQGCWFEPVAGERFDLVVSNPPYVAAADPALLALRAEPELALTPGSSGFEAFEAIVAAAPHHLNPSGVLAFEHGATQAPEVAVLLERGGFQGIISLRDAAGLPRVSLAEFHSAN